MDLKLYSSVIALGATVAERFDSEPYSSHTFPLSNTYLDGTPYGQPIIIEPHRFKYECIQQFGKAIDIQLENEILDCRNNIKITCNSLPNDFSRMVSAIEEANATFTGFLTPLNVKCKSILEYPAKMGTMDKFIGGMWSDAIILITKIESKDDKIEVWWGSKVRHQSAFVVYGN